MALKLLKKEVKVCSGWLGRRGTSMSVGTALVIGDERTLSRDQEESLTVAGIAIAHADDVPILEAGYDVVLAGVPEEPSDTADRLHSLAIKIPLILLADDSNLSDAYAVAGDAAFDCLPRSVNGAWLTHKVHQALQRRREVHVAPRSAAASESVLGGVKQGATLIGRSAAMERLRREIAEAARANLPVMVHGETGTGKDLVARLIHEAVASTRPGAFVKVSCPGFPEAALEDELFGRQEPDGRASRPGRIDLAARGTLLLDEISEMALGPQARLLDVLEPESGAPEAAAVRLVATSGLTRDQLYTTGQFRRDLYFRLNGYTIQLPPLREHAEDIPALVEFFLTKYAVLTGGHRAAVSAHTLATLSQYGWPGNVRELEVAVKRFAVSGDEAALTSTFVSTEQPLNNDGEGDLYHESERRVILSALTETRWNRRKAAKALGISYNTLRRRIQRYQLDLHAAR